MKELVRWFSWSIFLQLLTQLLKAVKTASNVISVRLAGEARVNSWGQECGKSWPRHLSGAPKG